MTATRSLSCDTQELTAALLIEPFGDLVDGLADCMGDPFGPRALPLADTGALRAAIRDHYDWALAIDLTDPDQTRRFWYVSEEKLEPRLGSRDTDPGAELESPLDIVRRIQALYRALPRESQPLRTFRSAHPEHDLAVGRVHMSLHHPYGEIRDNLIAGSCQPIDMLRCKLAVFGASKFDPKSDRWTRITLAQGAPLSDELANPDADDWWLPVFAA